MSEHILAPSDVEHFQVVFNNTDFLLLMRLIEILQNDRNVHIDDNHVIDYNEAGKVCDRQKWVATIAIRLIIKMWITCNKQTKKCIH